MADNYGSDDDYGNQMDGDVVEEGYSSGSEKSADYEDSPDHED
jgi:hypothetical protein